MQSNVKKIYDTLIDKNIKKTRVEIICRVGGAEFEVRNKDIMGNLIQSWLEVFLDHNKIRWDAPSNTQKYPDFILDDNQFMELKCWFKDATPAFDLANFKSLVNDLTINPKRLDSDYLIFNYGFDESGITINDFWVKKIWEITKIPTGKRSQNYNLISSQIKKGTIYNLRPFNFIKSPDECIGSKKDFLVQMKKTVDHFSDQLITSANIFKNGDEWMDVVNKKMLNDKEKFI